MKEFSNDALKKRGLPNNSKFIGYVVHLPNSDEFLALYQVTTSHIQRAFSKSPEHALKYKNLKKAIKHAQLVNQRAEVWLAFDTGKHITISPIE